MTRAFAFTPDNARGTKTFLEGILLEEIRLIRFVPGKYFWLEMNWIPDADGQQHLINLFIEQERASLSINLPAGYGTLGREVVVSDINIDLPAARVATLYAKLNIIDPADDGQIEAIDRWNDTLWEESEIGQMIKLYFAEERAKAQDHKYTRPAGGGFVEVVNSHTYHYSPDVADNETQMPAYPLTEPWFPTPEFKKWWESTNNSNFYSVPGRLTVPQLMQVAYEAWRVRGIRMRSKGL